MRACAPLLAATLLTTPLYPALAHIPRTPAYSLDDMVRLDPDTQERHVDSLRTPLSRSSIDAFALAPQDGMQIGYIFGSSLFSVWRLHDTPQDPMLYLLRTRKLIDGVVRNEEYVDMVFTLEDGSVPVLQRVFAQSAYATSNEPVELLVPANAQRDLGAIVGVHIKAMRMVDQLLKNNQEAHAAVENMYSHLKQAYEPLCTWFVDSKIVSPLFCNY